MKKPLSGGRQTLILAMMLRHWGRCIYSRRIGPMILHPGRYFANETILAVVRWLRSCGGDWELCKPELSRLPNAKKLFAWVDSTLKGGAL